MKRTTPPTVVIDNQSVKLDAIVRRMQNDVLFLSDRLRLLNQQRRPNPEVQKAYEDMLDSRRAIIEWLEDYSDGQCVSASNDDIRGRSS